MTKILHFEQNAKDAVSRLMSRRLIVPKVFFDAAWPDSGHHVDIVVIDHAGTGDVHVIEIKEHLPTKLIVLRPNTRRISKSDNSTKRRTT